MTLFGVGFGAYHIGSVDGAEKSDGWVTARDEDSVGRGERDERRLTGGVTD
jgi:hypothetical protein